MEPGQTKYSSNGNIISMISVPARTFAYSISVTHVFNSLSQITHTNVNSFKLVLKSQINTEDKTPIDKNRSPESIRILWTDESTNDLKYCLYEFDALQTRVAHVKNHNASKYYFNAGINSLLAEINLDLDIAIGAFSNVTANFIDLKIQSELLLCAYHLL